MKDIVITPEKVAEAIQEAITSPSKYPGGSVVEVLAHGSRLLPEWNIDPPVVKIPPEAVAKGMEPILVITAAEKGGRSS